MAIDMAAAFWMVSLMFVITPGADWAYAIAAGMHRGASRPAIAGLLLGHLAATLIVAAGVGVLITKIPFAMTGLTVLGSGYLMWLGVAVLVDPPVPAAEGAASARAPVSWLTKGFGVSGLNPKVFLLFLALLPQFVDPDAAWPIPVQMIALGVVHVVNCGSIYAIVAGGSQSILRTRPRAARAVGQFSGMIMIVLAVFILADRFLK